LSWCFVVVVVVVAAAAVVGAVAVGLAGVDYGVVVAVNGQQSQILGANCDSRYHPGTNGKK
jgi:hypothetical protein